MKRLYCPAVTPGTMVLSAASGSLFWRRSAALSSSFLHEAINVRLLSITISHHFPQSYAAVSHLLPYPIPNIRKLSARSSSTLSPCPPPRPRWPGFSRVLIVICFGNLRLSIRMSTLAHNNLLVRKVVSILSQPVRWRAR